MLHHALKLRLQTTSSTPVWVLFRTGGVRVGTPGPGERALPRSHAHQPGMGPLSSRTHICKLATLAACADSVSVETASAPDISHAVRAGRMGDILLC